MTHFKKPSLYKDVPYTATNSSTMSNGEVKRWYLYTENEALYAVSKHQRGFVPDASTIEVMPVEDHERIVADLRAEVEQVRKESEEMCNRVVFGFQLDRQKLNDELDIQKRVIEKLKGMVSHYETCATVDRYDDEEVPCDCGLEKELAAIEKGER